MTMKYVTHLETVVARADLFIIVSVAMINHDSNSNGILSSKKKLLAQNNVESKKVWIKKKFWVEKELLSKTMLGSNNLGQKDVGSRTQENFE